MCARTTKNTHWSDFVEPTAKPEHEEAKDGPLVFIKRDPAWVREVVVNFGCLPFTPDSPCAHKGPYRRGSMMYCPRCHVAGMDHDPALKRDPKTDPKPEPAPPSVPLTRESKKQRRKRERREAAKARPTTKAA